jgi:hypothetical protein
MILMSRDAHPPCHKIGSILNVRKIPFIDGTPTRTGLSFSLNSDHIIRDRREAKALRLSRSLVAETADPSPNVSSVNGCGRAGPAASCR